MTVIRRGLTLSSDSLSSELEIGELVSIGGAVSCMMSDECETLYVGNLNDRIKIQDLQALVYELFCGYGEVVSVHILRGTSTAGKPIRGTAFVSLRTTVQASTALRNLNNFSFLGKPLRVEFAKKQSDDLAKANGTYKPRYKPRKKIVASKND